MEFSDKVKKFVKDQHYTREDAITEEEFSQVAFRLYGCFFTGDLNLERMVEVANCALLARLSKYKPKSYVGSYGVMNDDAMELPNGPGPGSSVKVLEETDRMFKVEWFVNAGKPIQSYVPQGMVNI